MKINSKNRGFAQGTMIVMADGKLKPIEKIQTGDLVLSFDENDSTAPLEPRRVLDTFERIDNNVLEVKVGDNVLKVAQDQMFIGPYNDWKQVYNHSKVVDIDGNPVDYVVNKVSTGKHRIYDITVEENHSLVANGIRVHNADAGQTSSNTREGSGGAYNNGGGSGQSFNGGNRSGVGTGGGPADSNNAGARSPGNTNQHTTTHTQTKDKTTTGPQQKSPGGGGSTKSKSASASNGQHESPYGHGGQNNGVGNNGGNGQNASQRKANNGAKGFKKKGRKAKEEPDPKPNGSSVASKLIGTVEANVQTLTAILSSYNPTQLAGLLGTITATIEVSFAFAGSFVASIIASEMSAYDKAALLSLGTSVENTLDDVKLAIKGSTITAATQSLALSELVNIETYILTINATLASYLTADASGGFSVSVDGRPNIEPAIYAGTYRKDASGKYTKTGKAAKKIRGKHQSAANNA